MFAYMTWLYKLFFPTILLNLFLFVIIFQFIVYLKNFRERLLSRKCVSKSIDPMELMPHDIGSLTSKVPLPVVTVMEGLLPWGTSSGVAGRGIPGPTLEDLRSVISGDTYGALCWAARAVFLSAWFGIIVLVPSLPFHHYTGLSTFPLTPSLTSSHLSWTFRSPVKYM